MIFFYAILVVASLGILCILKDLIYPSPPTIEILYHHKPKRNIDYGNVILDSEENDQ
jgi:hypothetical protein